MNLLQSLIGVVAFFGARGYAEQIGLKAAKDKSLIGMLAMTPIVLGAVCGEVYCWALAWPLIFEWFRS